MADANFTVTLGALHDAIVAQLAAQFPSYKTVAFYRDDETEQLATPALLLDMTEAEPQPEADAGTGQWPVLLRFEARVILAQRGAASRLDVRRAATALATFLHLRRWTGIATDSCQVIACEPDEFAPHLDRFGVWRVEWVQLAFLGESAWAGGGETPAAYYSFAPKIGQPHASNYRPAVEALP